MNNQKMFFLAKYGELAKKSGIYRISVDRGLLGRKVYIGQAVQISTRWAAHVNLLKKSTHWIKDFQNDFDQYGINAFSFEIVLICERSADILARYEQAVLDTYNPDAVYNRWLKCTVTGAGTPASSERKAKIAVKITGMKRSPETKAAVGAAQAWKRTPEGREKMSAALRKAAQNRPPMSEEEREYRRKTTHFLRLSKESREKAVDTRIRRSRTLNHGSAWMLHG